MMHDPMKASIDAPCVRFHKQLALTLLVALALSACSSAPLREPQAWIVARTPKAPVLAPATAPLILVERPSLASWIRGMTILRANGQVDSLVYQEWAAEPSEMVGLWLRQRIEELGRFRVIPPLESQVSADATLKSRILHFEFVELPGGASEARVELEARWVDQNNRFTPLGRHFGSSRLIEASPEAMIEAMEISLDTAIESLVSRLQPSDSALLP